jgi:hypothetical protein
LKDKEALRAVILLGFLRHLQESLNNISNGGSSHFPNCFPRQHYSMLPASGYPLAGCSPAEPASVSPDKFFYMFRASVSILFKDDF